MFLWELSDDRSLGDDSHWAAAASNPKNPWLKEYNQYIDAWDELVKGHQLSNGGLCILSDHSILSSSLISSDSVQLNLHHLPVWTSLASDYPPIMASLVSSEHAFSSVRMTISKHHSHLKGDIIEALQCLKCMLLHD